MARLTLNQFSIQTSTYNYDDAHARKYVQGSTQLMYMRTISKSRDIHTTQHKHTTTDKVSTYFSVLGSCCALILRHLSRPLSTAFI